MKRIRIILEYEGTSYVGWQIQPNGVSIQQMLTDAIFGVTGERVNVIGSGRTDSGVHARAQVAHFDTQARMPADKFAVALNTHLPPDIRVLYSAEAPPDFHACFSAKQKQYRYTVQLGPHARVQTRNTALHLHTVPSFDLLQAAAAACVGTHDFRAFMATGSKPMEDTRRTIFSSEWSQVGGGSKPPPYWRYDVAGSGFLYNMVRILVGTMLEIGSGKLPPEAMTRALTGGARDLAGPTAPAHGLTLWRVCYPDFDTEDYLA
ncbi:MAG: tRNA pseudouridine(38-40) synthase TruA [Clostridiales bacterium]|nr:tRNA pseudouridine(38-40) synthase TruA [Clostridiales bacterium]